MRIRCADGAVWIARFTGHGIDPNEAYAAKQPFVDKETLEHIVEQFPTPFHLYDEAGIRRNMQEVRDAFAWNPGFKEYFAVKANPNPALISILNEYGCGCDCSSYTELMIARSLGITGHDIMFSSNDTPAADFELADKLGAIVNFDDISHIEFFEHVAGPIPRRSAAALIRAVCSSFPTASWITPATPSTA